MSYKGDYQAFLQLSAAEVQELVDDLAARPLTSDTIDLWLRDWADMEVLFQESLARLDIAFDVNTADREAEKRVSEFRQNIWPIGHKMHNTLIERLYAHEDLTPPTLVPTLHTMKRRAAFNQSSEAIALLNQENELMNAYGGLMGAHTIEWQGQTLTMRQAQQFLSDPDPAVRKEIWHVMMARRAQNRAAVHEIWQKLLVLRQKIAQVNGFDNYLDYCWQDLAREDYTPQQSEALHTAILAEWAPLHTRLMEEKRQKLGLERLATWDAEVSPESGTLKPFTTSDELITRTSRLFHRMDSDFGALFDHLVAIGLIDIAQRHNTAAVGGFARAVGRTGVFVMLNISGQHFDVVNLTHEMGHAFALIEACKRPYHLQWWFSQDFTETPSSVMEILAMPYWNEFYQAEDLTQARRYYFESIIRRNLFEVIIEAFQFWAYRHPDDAQDMARCDAKWLELRQQYLPGIDHTIDSEFIGMGWQHLYNLIYLPLLSMEYVYGRLAGLALLRNEDAAGRITHYKHAIGLGDSVTTAACFAAMGLPFFPTADEVAAAAIQVEGYVFDEHPSQAEEIFKTAFDEFFRDKRLKDSD